MKKIILSAVLIFCDSMMFAAQLMGNKIAINAEMPAAMPATIGTFIMITGASMISGATVGGVAGAIIGGGVLGCMLGGVLGGASGAAISVIFINILISSGAKRMAQKNPEMLERIKKYQDLPVLNRTLLIIRLIFCCTEYADFKLF